jgi:hypothetical protein
MQPYFVMKGIPEGLIGNDIDALSFPAQPTLPFGQPPAKKAST